MKTFNKTIFKSLLALLCALPLAVSCFDDSEIWDAINDLDARVDSLQNNLDVQIKTVSDMLSGKGGMVITNCVVNPDGSSVVTLSNAAAQCASHNHRCEPYACHFDRITTHRSQGFCKTLLEHRLARKTK